MAAPTASFSAALLKNGKREANMMRKVRFTAPIWDVEPNPQPASPGLNGNLPLPESRSWD
jgi:hypothetical protein